MAPRMPEGETAPLYGALPAQALEHVPSRPFALYVHVPFCRVRCGYCDFNTYVPAELTTGPPEPGAAPGASGQPSSFVDEAIAELALAERVLGERAPEVDTIFFGGGTPTLLPASDLLAIVDAARNTWGLRDGAEVTVEANPDTVTPELAHELAAGGVTRMSLGMQSAVPHVLATLERTHDAASVGQAVRAAKAAGLQVSLDVIYGTPGESHANWQRTLDEVLAHDPDHVSAYALTVEEGTSLHRRVRRGELPAPTDDDEADKYEALDDAMAGAGMQWYEISNFARSPQHRCQHNLHYWRGANWWGIGPGAHSHVGGVRWWNVKHPAAWAGRLAEGKSPALGREVLTAEQQREERVLLHTRLRDGMSIDVLGDDGPARVQRLVTDGLLDDAAAASGLVVPTRRGRLLADTVVAGLLL